MSGAAVCRSAWTKTAKTEVASFASCAGGAALNRSARTAAPTLTQAHLISLLRVREQLLELGLLGQRLPGDPPSGELLANGLGNLAGEILARAHVANVRRDAPGLERPPGVGLLLELGIGRRGKATAADAESVAGPQ